MKVREPVARPLDIVSIELLLSASQAFLMGMLVYLAVGIWEDRGVGLGPTAAILALLGLAVGASWLFWLLGGTGWPMAASNTPAALFLGFALLLGWQGQGFVRLDALPLLLGSAAAIYGIVCGVFLDSPRRWRWDQRQRLRPGTQVPRISETTRAVVARVPRSLPRRETMVPGPDPGPATGPGPAGPVASAAHGPEPRAAPGLEGEVATPRSLADVDERGADVDVTGLGRSGLGQEADASTAGASTGERGVDDAAAVPAGLTAVEPRATDRLARGRTRRTGAEASGSERTPGGIELPTSVEPKAQRSPWAWAAPPEWNRNEDDEPPESGSGSGS